MCKQPSTLQTTQNTTQSVPGYVSDAQQALLGYGSGMLGNFLGAVPNYRVAGTNADQQQAYDLARQTAQNAYTTNVAPQVNAGSYQPASVGAPMSYAPASIGGGASYDANTVSGGDIQALMNPYTQSVIDPALANMRRQSDINSAQIGAQSAAAGSYGGSREALRQAQNTRSLGEQTAQLVPQLYSQAYGQAAGLAQSNAAARNAAAQFGASSDFAARQQDSNALTNSFAANANARNAFTQTDANALNTAAQYNLNRNLTAAQMQSGLYDAQQARQLAAAQFLRQIGGDQQTQLQNILNSPLGALAAYQSIVPTQIPVNSNSVGTQPNTAPGLGQQLLGGALTLGGQFLGTNTGASLLGGLFACDARLKKNIAPYGTDARGRPLFAFHYKWEDDDAPLTVGPMAQIEEEHDPESVVEALGIKLVRVF